MEVILYTQYIVLLLLRRLFCTYNNKLSTYREVCPLSFSEIILYTQYINYL